MRLTLAGGWREPAGAFNSPLDGPIFKDRFFQTPNLLAFTLNLPASKDRSYPEPGMLQQPKCTVANLYKKRLMTSLRNICTDMDT